MLVRLQEIVQLSTGISFRNPYPALVGAELEAARAASAATSNAPAGTAEGGISFAEWRRMSPRVFMPLRGGVTASSSATDLAAAAAAAPAANAAPAAVPAAASRHATPRMGPSAGTTLVPPGQDLLAPSGPSSAAVVVPSPGVSAAAAAAAAQQYPASTATATGMSPSRFLRQVSMQGLQGFGHTRRNTFDNSEQQQLLQSQHGSAGGGSSSAAGGGGSGTASTYTASSRATHANNTIRDLRSNTNGGGGGGANDKTGSPASPTTTPPGAGGAGASAGAIGTYPTIPSPEKLRSQAMAAMSRVKSRITAQQRALALMSPGSSQRHSLFVSEANWAHTLHSGDLDKLSASLASSVAHDAMVLREMLPSFTAMFDAVRAHAHERRALLNPALTGQKPMECCTLDDVRLLLEMKLLLPLASCQSIMQVLSLAQQSCLTAAESAAYSAAVPGAASTAPAVPSAGAAASGVVAPDAPLPPSAFTGSLSGAAFAAVLSKALHLQSSPFCHFLSPALNFASAARSVCAQVFLGGSCNPTTWRVDEAIPCLSAAGISFFNPQVDNWSTELVLIESLIKSNCDTLLFVIDSDTRAIASMIEAAEYICQGRDVVMVVKTLSEDGTGAQPPASVNGERLGAAQVRELNRARSYVTDLAQRHGVDVFTDIGLACEYIVSKIRSAQSLAEQHAREVESFVASDEFVEKTLEEFCRCDTQQTGVLDATQLLLAALHLEQDLRPLLPAQAAAKHRQPQLSDVEQILNKFGAQQQQGPGAAAGPPRGLGPEEFLNFSRVLFRNVCAHVKL